MVETKTTFTASECQALLDLIDKICRAGNVITPEESRRNNYPTAWVETEEEYRAYNKLRKADKFFVP
jgi:hypothetical protein